MSSFNVNNTNIVSLSDANKSKFNANQLFGNPIDPLLNPVTGSILYWSGTNIGSVNNISSRVALGTSAGSTNQQTGAIAIGPSAGFTQQGTGAIAIGPSAGYTGQGSYAIAIGANAGLLSQHTESIILNASSTGVESAGTGRFYVKPVRALTTSVGATGSLVYNIVSNEITYDVGKSFVIDHPLHKNKYLVHACLEGPEAGVYYRGESKIENQGYLGNGSVEITLPDYTDKLADSFTVQLTPINNAVQLCTTKVEKGKFTVSGPNTEFYWLVHGNRTNAPLTVEPNKKETIVSGEGPYTWCKSKTKQK